MARVRAAEQQLAAEFVAGKLANVDRVVTLHELGAWKYEDGLKGMPAELRALSGQRVAIAGLMMRHPDYPNGLFLLWPTDSDGPRDGPNTHEFVSVTGATGMPDAPLPIARVVGRFAVSATLMDGSCIDVYQLHAERVDPVQ